MLGHDPSRDADRIRPLIGAQLQDAALPDRLRLGEAVTLFARRRGPRGADRWLTYAVDRVQNS